MDFMEEAIKEAEKAFEKGEVPIGAVIIKDNEIIGRGHNIKELTKDVTAHAEIIAIKEAEKYINDWRLTGCEMYVTVEPCPMCAAAIVQSRISKLYIGTFNREMGACGTVMDILDNRGLNSYVPVKWSYDKRCEKLITDFFKKGRKRKK